MTISIFHFIFMPYFISFCYSFSHMLLGKALSTIIATMGSTIFPVYCLMGFITSRISHSLAFGGTEDFFKCQFKNSHSESTDISISAGCQLQLPCHALRQPYEAHYNNLAEWCSSHLDLVQLKESFILVKI